MDELDHRLIAELRINARASIPKLASILGVARGTIQTRMERLMASGTIAGFTVKLKDHAGDNRIRGVMMIALAGRHKKPVIASLKKLPGFSEIHLTNGIWDLIASIEVGSLAEFNQVVTATGEHDGVSKTESYLFLGPA